MRALVVSFCLVPACYGTEAEEAPSDSASSTDHPEPRFTEPIDLRNGTLSVATQVGRFDRSATTLEGWDYGGAARVNVGASDSSGAEMLVLDVVGGLDHPALTPGSVLDFNQSGLGSAGLEVYATGCRGPTPDEYTFEVRAESVEVRAAEGLDSLAIRLEFAARFDGGELESLDASFDFVPNG